MDVIGKARRPRFVLAMLGAGAIVAAGMNIASASLSESHDTVHVIYHNPQRLSTATAVCPGKKHVAFGGFYTDTDNSQQTYAFPDGTGPKGTNKWTATTHNESAAKAAKLQSFAYCFSGAKPEIEKGPVASAAQGDVEPLIATVSCSGAHKTLLGGGFSVDADTGTGRIVITEMQRADDRSQWQVGIINNRNTEVHLRAIAVCGKGPAPQEQFNTKGIEVSNRQSVVANCPGDQEAVFGGLRAQHDDNGISYRAAFPMALMRAGKGSIKASALATASNFNGTADLTAIAYCR